MASPLVEVFENKLGCWKRVGVVDPGFKAGWMDFSVLSRSLSALFFYDLALSKKMKSYGTAACSSLLFSVSKSGSISLLFPHSQAASALGRELVGTLSLKLCWLAKVSYVSSHSFFLPVFSPYAF